MVSAMYMASSGSCVTMKTVERDCLSRCRVLSRICCRCLKSRWEKGSSMRRMWGS